MAEELEELEKNLQEEVEEVVETFSKIQPDWSDIKSKITPLYPFVLMTAFVRRMFKMSCVAAVNNCTIETADIETMERAFGPNRGIYRKQPKPTRYLCDVVITEPNSTIQKDVFFCTDNIFRKNLDNDDFVPRFTASGTISFETTGTHQAEIVCETDGPILLEINKSLTISTPTSGVSSITPTLLIEQGRYLEDEQEYNAEVISADVLLQGTSGTNMIVRQRLETEADVIRAAYYQNNEGYNKYGVIPPGSVCVVCYGGDEEKIFNTLFNTNIQTWMFGYGTLQRTRNFMIDPIKLENGTQQAGQSVPYVYNLAVPVIFDIKITLTSQIETTSEMESFVRRYISVNRICDFMRTITSNDVLFGCLEFIKNNMLQTNVFSVEFSTDGVNYSSSVAPSSCFEIFVLRNIEITSLV